MIDLHTHLLPGVDDGSRALDVSVRVLQRFAREGVTTVACTPHLAASQAHSAPVDAYAALRATVQESVVGGPRLVAGFEIMLDRPGADLRAPGLTLGDSRAVLVEFPRSALPPGATDELLRIRASGLVPVVAHPERYNGATVDLVQAWRDLGAVIQGDALMLLSTGKMAKLARTLIEEGLYDILASDNHGDRRSLSTVREWLRELGGDAQGRVLTEDNPRRVLHDEAVERVLPLRQEQSAWQRLRTMLGRR
ncbi:MAG: CpsB/CapC family capsule biosynthesis tyrosine phosphatase [Gemmatimonadota bacterium]